MPNGNDSSDDVPANVVTFQSQDEVDQHVVRQRLRGAQVRTIGRNLGLSDKQVLSALDRALPTLDAGLRQRLFKLDLDRTDLLLEAFFERALGGHLGSAEYCLKVLQR